MRYLKDEELQLASRFLFLSMAMTVIEQDMKQIQAGTFKIKEPYLELLEKMASKATKERKHLRQIMYKRDLKVVFVNKDESFSSYLFLCRGKEEQRNYFNPAIRKKVESIIRELIKESFLSA